MSKKKKKNPKAPNSKDPGKKTEVLGTLSSNGIYVTRIITANDGFIVLTYNEKEVDKIFNNNTDKQLQEKNFAPSSLPNSKQINLFSSSRVDNYIFAQNENEIKDEIIEHNEWVEEICQIYEFPNSNTLKIAFKESARAIKGQEHGIKMFSMRIPASTQNKKPSTVW